MEDKLHPENTHQPDESKQGPFGDQDYTRPQGTDPYKEELVDPFRSIEEDFKREYGSIPQEGTQSATLEIDDEPVISEEELGYDRSDQVEE